MEREREEGGGGEKGGERGREIMREMEIQSVRER